MTLIELTTAIDALRARGVKEYRDIAGGGFEVEFFPTAPDVKGEPIDKTETKCKCGHEQHEHGGGLCLLGCDPMKCAPPE